MSPLDQIRANAEEVDRLWRRIHETFAIRDRSKGHSDAWAKACEEFHHGYADLAFPGGQQRWAAFLARDSSELETALAFLEANPRFFRSGYLKQIIWGRLKCAPLTPGQERRLEAVASDYLQSRVQREFWYMARYVRLRGSPHFWQTVETWASENADPVATRAHWLLLAKENAPVRMWIDNELRRARYEPGYQPRLRFSLDRSC